MVYVWTASWKTGLSREQTDGALIRRVQWSYPEGARVLGEYWTADSQPAVIVILEADDFAPIMELGMTWGDVFDITCRPAVTAEEGLRIGPEVMGRRQI